MPVTVQAAERLLRGDGKVQAAIAKALQDVTGAQVGDGDLHPWVFAPEGQDALIDPIEHGCQRGDPDRHRAQCGVLDGRRFDLQATDAFDY